MSSNYTEYNSYKGVFVYYTSNESSSEIIFKEELSRQYKNDLVGLEAVKGLLIARTKTMTVTTKQRHDELQIEVNQPVNLVKYCKLAILQKFDEEHAEGQGYEVETGRPEADAFQANGNFIFGASESEVYVAKSSRSQVSEGEASESQAARSEVPGGQTAGGEPTGDGTAKNFETSGETYEDVDARGEATGDGTAENFETPGETATGEEAASGQDPTGDNNSTDNSDATANNRDNVDDNDIIYNKKEEITTSGATAKKLHRIRTTPEPAYQPPYHTIQYHTNPRITIRY